MYIYILGVTSITGHPSIKIFKGKTTLQLIPVVIYMDIYIFFLEKKIILTSVYKDLAQPRFI